MALKYEIEKLEDVEAGMRPHYVKAADSAKFRIALDGEPADSAKVAEFRATNVAIMKERDDLRARFDGIDPEVVKAERAKLAEFETARPDARIAELETALAAEKASNAEAQKRATRSTLRDTFRTKLLAAGVLPAAVDIALDKVDPYFTLVGDSVRAKPNIFSKTQPGVPLTPDDWVAETIQAFPFLFGPTTGGGGSGPGSKNSSTANELRDPDARQLGEFAADIASGKMRVIRSGE